MNRLEQFLELLEKHKEKGVHEYWINDYVNGYVDNEGESVTWDFTVPKRLLKSMLEELI